MKARITKGIAKILLAFAAIAVLSLVFLLFNFRAKAETQPLELVNSDIGLTHGCSYYKLYYSDSLIYWMSDVTTLQKSYVREAVGKFKNLEIDWRINQTYNVTIPNCTTVCSPYNITNQTTGNTTTIPNCTTTCYPYNETKWQWVYEPIWKADIKNGSYTNANFTSNLNLHGSQAYQQTVSDGYIMIRFCGDFERQLTRNGWEVSLDHVPSFKNVDYPFYTWWNSSWQYRRNITINNTQNSNTLTDYQVVINLTYSSNMQPDFSDIRFTWYNSTNGSEIEIPYWIESKSNSQWAYVWVKVPYIPASSNTTIYVYYGNPSATSLSNGTATFDYFDDFSTDTTNQYTRYDQGSSTTLYWDSTQGTVYSFGESSGFQHSWVAKSYSSYTDSRKIIAMVKASSTSGQNRPSIILLKSSDLGTFVYLGVEPDLGYIKLHKYISGTDNTVASIASASYNTWYVIQMVKIGTTYYVWYSSSPSSLTSGGSYSITDSALTGYTPLVGFSIRNNNPRSDFDYYIIAKYTSPEPTYSIGAEEIANTAPAVNIPKTYDENLNENSNFEVNKKVVIRANVTDAQGAGDISKVLLTLVKPDSTTLGNFTMVNISSITNGYVYEYNYTPDVNGTWQVKVFANDTQNAWGSNSTTFIAYLNMTISNVSEVKSFQPTEFIQVNGTNLMLGNQPYRFVGMNSYYLVDYATNFTYDDDGNPIYNSRQYVLEVLNEMHYLNLNVLRTWGGMECGYANHQYSVWDCNNSGGHYNVFQKYTHGNWSEEMYQALDWLIYEAGKRDIRIALVLVNNWKEYGGMRWYVQQSPTTNKTWENITDDNDSRFWEFHDQFYSDANAKQYFKDFINHTLWRNNTYTGRYYKDDPTIAMWILANEPRAKSQGSNYTLIRNWTQEMVNYIRSIDTNHIIALGIEGWGDPWEGTAFINNQNLGNLSIATYNINPYQWDWFAQRSEYATDLDWADEGWNTTKVIDWWTNNTSLSYNNRYETDYVPNYNPNLGRHGYKDWVRQHVAWANVNLSKPIMAMEVLYPLRKGKVAVDGDKATYDLRVKFFNQTVKNFFDNGGDGLLFWVLQHDNYYWSTANSSYAGKMDDGFGFYVSDNATLSDSSKPVIDTLTWIRDSGYVNLLNDYKYNFNYKPEISGANPKNATLYLFINNENGTSYTVKITNTSEVKNKDLNAFTYQFQRVCGNSDKNFTYIIEVCSDNPTLGCTNTTQSNTIIILTAKPAITLNSPAEKRYPSLTQVFDYTVTADLDITYCQLFINSTANKTSTTVNKNVPQTFVVNFDKEGSYEWYVECSDVQSNLGNSPKRTLVIGSPKWFDNKTYVPTTYNYNTLSVFNITWNDSLGYSIDTVLFESNYSGMPKNYTMVLIDPYINATEKKGVYNYNLTLPAGTFYWKSYANASDGVWNSTDTWYFTITPPTTTLPPVHGVPLLSSTLVGIVIGVGILTFMLRTLFDIREPKKVIEYFIVLAVIVLTVLSLIALFA
jgi:hypothetical protein